mmetsp:Transcript_21053/g.39161  ORF Transcript_21053/g.39161 Transcript_21053/m.39161 type:complete len:476 (-) Transcript_21053:51-1478(-)
MRLWHHLLCVMLVAHAVASGTAWPQPSWLLAISVLFSHGLAEDCFVNEEQFMYCCCGEDASRNDCWPSNDVKQMWAVCCKHLASACPEKKETATTTAAPMPRAVKATAKAMPAQAPRAVKAAPTPRAAKATATTTAAPAPRAAKISAQSKPKAEMSEFSKMWQSGSRKPKAKQDVAVDPAGVPSLPLLGGGSIPMSGVGLCCRPSAKGDAVRQGVLDFLLLGGRHLDDAKLYNNHKEVGLGIKQALAAGVPRSEIFLTTKIWPSDFGFESTTAWVDLVLEELGLQYIDLVLLHTASVPGGLKCKQPRACRQETWLALQRAQADSKILHLGVSNFGARQMGEILALQGSPIEVNQIEFHPWVPTVHLETAKWCQQHGIVVTAYGSMGSSGLAEQMMMQDTLKEIGAAHGKSAGQVLLRWAVQKNVTVIPGTSNPKHQEENLRIFDFALSGAEMAALDSVPEDQRMLHFGHTPDEKP